MKVKNWFTSLAVPVFGAFVFSLVSAGGAGAVPCGAMTCDLAADAVGSPYSVGDTGSFDNTVSVLTTPTGPGTPFAHAIPFELTEAANIQGTFTNLNSLATFNIVDLTLQLFDSSNVQQGGSFTTANEGAGFGTQPLVNFAFLNLIPDDYIFKVFGEIGPQSENGQYSAQYNVSQVPLPGAVWLFISAILGLVSFSRIKRGRAEAA